MRDSLYTRIVKFCCGSADVEGKRSINLPTYRLLSALAQDEYEHTDKPLQMLPSKSSARLWVLSEFEVIK